LQGAFLVQKKETGFDVYISRNFIGKGIQLQWAIAMDRVADII
jgi:hypothetical protein